MTLLTRLVSQNVRDRLKSEGAQAWLINGEQGITGNPYISGDENPAEAQLWWEGYDHARNLGRRGLERLPGLSQQVKPKREPDKAEQNRVAQKEASKARKLALIQEQHDKAATGSNSTP